MYLQTSVDVNPMTYEVVFLIGGGLVFIVIVYMLWLYYLLYRDMLSTIGETRFRYIGLA